MRLIVFSVISLLLLQSCGSVVTYNKINLRSVDRSSFLQERMNETEDPYTFFVHTLDSVGDPLALFQAIKPKVVSSVFMIKNFRGSTIKTPEVLNGCYACIYYVFIICHLIIALVYRQKEGN